MKKRKEEQQQQKSGEKVKISSAQKKDEFLTRRRGRKLESLLVDCKSGRRGPTCRTPVIAWKEQQVGGAQNTIIKAAATPSSANNNNNYNNFLLFHPCSSSRKLGVVIWEFHHYYYYNNTSSNMYNSNGNHHQRERGRRFHHRVNNDEGFDHHHQINHPSLPVDPHTSATPDHQQPSSAGSLRRHIAASLMRHHQLAERNKHALQPLSPASYGSSLEMAPYNPAATPDSSIELRGKIGESSYSFKTSTELLKVLNRIWTLEEQHASNVSLVKALKNELDHARSRIKELLRDQQVNRHEIDELMKQISEDNIARKSKEHERLEAALQSVRGELEDERKLRKRSESLHRKLARELFEIKVALSTTVKELEKERKSSELLEEICDEFAKTIREYAKQLHDVKQKSDKDWTGITNHDNLILHISESWLDERTQQRDRESQKASVVDKLRPEIETFLTARQTADMDNKDTDHKDNRSRRRSLESIPEVGTAPDDSTFTDAHCIEISKVGPSHYTEQEELVLSGRRKGQSPPSVQMSEPHTTSRETDSKVIKTGEGTPTEISMLQKSDIYDSYQKKKNYIEEGNGSNSKTVDKLISELLLSEGSSYPPEYEYYEAAASNNPPTLKRNASPVRQWVTSMKSPDPRISESSSKMHSVRENSLKAKLQEPKSKGQRSRLKILKGSS